jgi:predicted permease
VSVFEAAMASMVTVAVLAAEYELEPRLTSAMVGLGIPLSLLTGAGWWFVLQFWP